MPSLYYLFSSPSAKLILPLPRLKIYLHCISKIYKPQNTIIQQHGKFIFLPLKDLCKVKINNSTFCWPCRQNTIISIFWNKKYILCFVDLAGKRLLFLYFETKSTNNFIVAKDTFYYGFNSNKTPTLFSFLGKSLNLIQRTRSTMGSERKLQIKGLDSLGDTGR